MRDLTSLVLLHWLVASLARTPPSPLLERHRRLPTSAWQRLLEPSAAVLLQVGAFTHSVTAGHSEDAAVECMKQGWAATLIEPAPSSFASLRRRYAVGPRLRLVNGAVCHSCAKTSQPMWWVDLQSTLHHGSNDSDTRCAVSEAPGIAEFSSLTEAHVTRQAYLFQRSPNRCARCASRIQRPLPPTCLSKVIEKNLRRTEVRCVCLHEEARMAAALARHPTARASAAGTPTPLLEAVSLLMIDAEGHDFEVLASYPFGSVPTWRVMFEAHHMRNKDFDSASALLRSHGFEKVAGGYKAFQVIFHNVNSSEALLHDR